MRRACLVAVVVVAMWPALASADEGGFPEVAEPEAWYARSFPAGLAGVWENRMGEIVATPIGRAGGDLWSVVVPSSGELPEWKISGRLGPLDLGELDLSLPAELVQLARTVVLIVAAFGAFRIIFG